MNIIANLFTLEGTCVADEGEVGDTSGASPRAGDTVHMDDLRVSGWSAEREQDRWYTRIPWPIIKMIFMHRPRTWLAWSTLYTLSEHYNLNWWLPGWLSKPGKHLRLTSLYRPINILSAFSKVWKNTFMSAIERNWGWTRFTGISSASAEGIVTPRGLTQAVFSNRHSRPYNVSVRSSYLTAGSYTLYRRAHSCRQAASSRNVEFGPLRFPRKNRHTWS